MKGEIKNDIRRWTVLLVLVSLLVLGRLTSAISGYWTDRVDSRVTLTVVHQVEVSVSEAADTGEVR